MPVLLKHRERYPSYIQRAMDSTSDSSVLTDSEKDTDSEEGDEETGRGLGTSPDTPESSSKGGEDAACRRLGTSPDRLAGSSKAFQEEVSCSQSTRESGPKVRMTINFEYQ